MAEVTTTSGMAWKIAGRCGDSTIIGGGLWLDQDVGGAGSTGRGEENLRVCGAHTVVENMRHGMSPKESILDTLKRVSRNFDNDLDRLAQIDLSFYALRSEEHTSELQSHLNLVCRLLLEKKKKKIIDKSNKNIIKLN